MLKYYYGNMESSFNVFNLNLTSQALRYDNEGRIKTLALYTVHTIQGRLVYHMIYGRTNCFWRKNQWP